MAFFGKAGNILREAASKEAINSEISGTKSILPILQIIRCLSSMPSSTLVAGEKMGEEEAGGSGLFGVFQKPGAFNAIQTLNARDVLASFKEWFKTNNNNALPVQIFHILSSQDSANNGANSLIDQALAQLNLRLSEPLVLEVLSYGQSSSKDVLACLKFFDWAGHQPGFFHTSATFHAIFRILSRAKLMSVLLQFLQDYAKYGFPHKVRFHDTLVIGYAVAGKPEIALEHFGRMRFMGNDLDGFTYHVLLHALVVEDLCDAVDMVVKQISMRGYENYVTHSIIVKSFCRQDKLEEAEGYLRRLVEEGKGVCGKTVGIVVDELCKKSMFKEAGRLLTEFGEFGTEMGPAYGIWIRDLVQVGKIDGALDFLKSKKLLEGYVPEIFCYNSLVFRLLRENRLEDVWNLLSEMEENEILPDKFTMTAVLCFFCKAGMVDFAFLLYNSSSEFGLSPNSMAYNYLINTLCGNRSISEAYDVLKDSIVKGCLPHRKTFLILARALYREKKVDKMKELVTVALERNIALDDFIYEKFISALCAGGRFEDGYLMHNELGKYLNKRTANRTYISLIYGSTKLKRADVAARLLLELQEKGYTVTWKYTRRMYRTVVGCICSMENPNKLFFNLLSIQLSLSQSSAGVYNFFIEGAGRARRPDLAREVYDLMQRNGCWPSLRSKIFMLQSYLKSGRIYDALSFFNSACEGKKQHVKLYNSMISGLCKAGKPNYGLNILKEMKAKNLKPSLECYEVLIQSLCSSKQIDLVMNLIDDLEKSGRRISSFIGNTLLSHSLRSRELYETWIQLKAAQNKTMNLSQLEQLIGVFSGSIRKKQDIEEWEDMIAKCFPLEVYTYNILLAKLCSLDIEDASMLFNQMVKKGYAPDEWTFRIMVHGLLRHGKKAEAERLMKHKSSRRMILDYELDF